MVVHRNSGCRRRLIAEQRFDLEEFLETEHATLTPIAGVLITSEWRGWVWRRAIQIDATGPQAQCNAAGVFNAGRVYPSGQTIDRIVRDRYGLVLGVVRKNGQHRPEDLLLGNRECSADVAKYGWLDEVALFQPRRTAQAAGDQGRAVFDTGANQSLNFVELRLAGHGPHSGIRCARIPDLERLGRCPGKLERTVVLGTVDQHAGGGL